VQSISECPEDTLFNGGFVYNAKAHPHLSGMEDLLISYNVNTSDFFELFNNADSYRPRFIRYFPSGNPSKLKNSGSEKTKAIIRSYRNFPNPFNSQTSIEFYLEKNSDVFIALFNTVGEKVATLANGKRIAGRHIIPFFGQDDHGRSLPSGIYYGFLKTNNQVVSLKMVLMK